MTAHARVVIVLVVLMLVPLLHAAAPPTMTGVDRQGDPLPRGAVARLGTTRLRHTLDAGSAYSQLIFSPDGKKLLSRGADGIRLWDVSSGQRLPWSLYGPSPETASLLPDGKTLVTARGEASVQNGRQAWHWVVERWNWGKETPQSRVQLPAHTGITTSLVSGLFSPHGKLLVSCDHLGKPVMYDTIARRLLYRLEVEIMGVAVVTFTPDSKQLILLSAKGGVYVYDTLTGKRVRELVSDASPESLPYTSYNFPEVSPDGRLLAYSGSRELFLRDMLTGRLLARKSGVVGAVAFSPDGKALACVANRAIHLLEARTLKVIRIFEAGHAPAWTLAISFRGLLLLFRFVPGCC